MPKTQKDFPSPYLYQQESWEEFWLATKDKKHECFEINATSSNITLSGIVYSYPWHFNQQIMHLPGGPFIQNNLQNNDLEIDIEELKDLLILFFAKISSVATQKQILSLTVDLDPYITYLLKKDDSFDFITWLKSKSNQNIGVPVISSKNFLFEKVALIDLDNLKAPSELDSTKNIFDSLGSFFEDNSDYWLSVSETARKQTRNSLKQDLIISTLKNQENIDVFYEVLEKTAQRQKFSIQPKDYFSDLINQNFAHLLIVKSLDQKVSNVWLGLEVNNSLINLFGGNVLDTEVRNGNNFSHLYGMYIAKKLNKKFYDLGGYDPKGSTAKFKNSYKPQIINFGGHFDLVYLPWYYKIIEIGLTGKKVLKK